MAACDTRTWPRAEQGSVAAIGGRVKTKEVTKMVPFPSTILDCPRKRRQWKNKHIKLNVTCIS
jgi:hypothetical protein